MGSKIKILIILLVVLLLSVISYFSFDKFFASSENKISNDIGIDYTKYEGRK